MVEVLCRIWFELATYCLKIYLLRNRQSWFGNFDFNTYNKTQDDDMMLLFT